MSQQGEITATLVLRYKADNGEIRTRIWHGPNVEGVLYLFNKAFTRASEARSVRARRWNKIVDAYITENYGRRSASQIAAWLTKTYKRSYTKNMIISRYHRVLKND